MPFSLWVGLGAVIGLGVLGWSWGRGIAIAPGETPERVSAFMGRLVQAVTLLVVGLLVVGQGVLWPLAALAGLAAWFPVRRRLFAETRGFAGYLLDTLRFVLALFPGPLLAIVAPAWIAELDGPALYLAASALAVAVFVVEVPVKLPLALRLLGARRVDDAGLRERLQAIAQRANLPLPDLVTAGAPGAHWPLTVGLFGRRSCVLVSHTLLTRLSADEVTALVARDLAYCEAAWRRRRLLALLDLGFGLAAGGLAVAAAWQPYFALGAPVLWMAYMKLGMTGLPDESGRDRRALELVGDGEALVRALVRLNELNFAPRRQDPEVEKASGAPPSLARRIQLIQEAAGDAYRSMPVPPASAPDTLIVATGPTACLLLEPARAAWLDGVGADATQAPGELLAAARAARIVAYADLAALAVTAKGSGHVLAAAGKDGSKWSVDLRGEDVAAVQAHLDRIDTQLGRGAAPRAVTHIGVLVGLAGLGVAVLEGPLAVLLLPASAALFAPLRPSFAALAGVAGVLTLAGAATSSFSFALLGLTVAAALVAWRTVDVVDERSRKQRRHALAAHAFAAVMQLLPVAAWFALPTADPTLAGTLVPGPLAALAGLGVIVLCGVRRPYAWIGCLPLALVVAGGACLLCAPTRSTGEGLEAHLREGEAVFAERVGQIPLDGPVDDLRVSADGLVLAIQRAGTWELVEGSRDVDAAERAALLGAPLAESCPAPLRCLHGPNETLFLGASDGTKTWITRKSPGGMMDMVGHLHGQVDGPSYRLEPGDVLLHRQGLSELVSASRDEPEVSTVIFPDGGLPRTGVAVAGRHVAVLRGNVVVLYRVPFVD